MRNTFHGVVSLSLMFISIMIGLLYIISDSIAMGLLYFLIIIVSLLIITYSFCAKCPCRFDSCGHILPGKLSQLLPIRKNDDYTAWDFTGVVMPVAALLIFPQFWIWEDKIALIVFWLLFFISLIEIRLYVCKVCKNEKCPFGDYSR